MDVVEIAGIKNVTVIVTAAQVQVDHHLVRLIENDQNTMKRKTIHIVADPDQMMAGEKRQIADENVLPHVTHIIDDHIEGVDQIHAQTDAPTMVEIIEVVAEIEDRIE